MSGSESKSVDYSEFSALKADITDMKGLMARMVEAMGRITVIEERQHVLAQNSAKAIDRMEQLTERLHESEVANAVQQSLAQRTTNIETAFRELHVENERNKARFETVVWMVRGLWAVALACGGGVVWLAQAIQHAPIPGVK